MLAPAKHFHVTRLHPGVWAVVNLRTNTPTHFASFAGCMAFLTFLFLSVGPQS